jgi:hypothetical protein
MARATIQLISAHTERGGCGLILGADQRRRGT